MSIEAVLAEQIGGSRVERSRCLATQRDDAFDAFAP
jgi:hypothetical protein